MPFPLTEEQRNIVDDRGGELLVSAAAGSGKTRVLVERLFLRVLGEEQANIDDFLIITYTKAAAAELRREDALRRLAQLAFGRANDAARLALNPREVDPGALDLSAVAEIKVTDKGGVEVKLVDRVRALETLCGLLEERGGGAEELYRALEEAAEQLEDGYGG